MRHHPHAWTWTKGALGLRLYRLAGHKAQAVALHGHGYYQGCLHEREVVADTQARAAPNGR